MPASGNSGEVARRFGGKRQAGAGLSRPAILREEALPTAQARSTPFAGSPENTTVAPRGCLSERGWRTARQRTFERLRSLVDRGHRVACGSTRRRTRKSCGEDGPMRAKAPLGVPEASNGRQEGSGRTTPKRIPADSLRRPAPCTLRQVGSLSRSRASDPLGNAPTVYGLEEPRRQRRSHRALLASPRALVADGTTDHEALAALAADQGSPPDPFGEAHPAARRACLQANAAALLRDAFGQPEESGSLAGRPQGAQGHFGTMRWKRRARPEEPASVRAPRTRPPGFRAGKG